MESRVPWVWSQLSLFKHHFTVPESRRATHEALVRILGWAPAQFSGQGIDLEVGISHPGCLSKSLSQTQEV